MKAQTEMSKLGWRLVLARPVAQTYHFERYAGRRKAALIMLTSKTTPSAWVQLRRIIKADGGQR